MNDNLFCEVCFSAGWDSSQDFMAITLRTLNITNAGPEYFPVRIKVKFTITNFGPSRGNQGDRGDNQEDNNNNLYY